MARKYRVFLPRPLQFELCENARLIGGYHFCRLGSLCNWSCESKRFESSQSKRRGGRLFFVSLCLAFQKSLPFFSEPLPQQASGNAGKLDVSDFFVPKRWGLSKRELPRQLLWPLSKKSLSEFQWEGKPLIQSDRQTPVWVQFGIVLTGSHSKDGLDRKSVV